MPRIKKVRTLRPRQSEDAYIDGLICGIKGWPYGCNPYDYLPQHSLQGKPDNPSKEFQGKPDNPSKEYAQGNVGYTVWVKPSISEKLERAIQRRYKRPTFKMNQDPAEDWTRGWLEGSRQVGEVKYRSYC